MELTLDLADGFLHEHVVVLIDREEILNAHDVNTRPQDGRALRLKHMAEGSRMTLTVVLPLRRARAERVLRLDTCAYVQVNLDHHGTLHLIEQRSDLR